MNIRIFSLVFLIFIASLSASAQKVALIDMEYIMSKLPAYTEYRQKLDERRDIYQKAIEKQEAEVQALYKKFQKEGKSLTPDQRSQREEEIISKEENILTLKHKYFSPEGELEKYSKELRAPIDNALWQVLKTIAQTSGYSIIIDKTSSKIVYANPDVDLSGHVLYSLGIN